MTILRKSSLVVASIAMLMSGCAQDNANNNNDRVAELEKQIADLKASKSDKGADSLVPTDAKTGECYARVLVPAEYKTITKEVMTSEGTQKVVITPASYKMEDKKILAQEESYKCKLVPATYKTVTEKVMVAPAKTKLVNVPAKYKQVKQKINQVIFAEEDLFGFLPFKNSLIVKDFSNLVNFCVYNYGKQ